MNEMLATLNTKIVAQGSSNYSVRNALCNNNPDAKIIIKDVETTKS